MKRQCCLLPLLGALLGCAGEAARYDVPLVSAALEERSGYRIETRPWSTLIRAGETAIPEGVHLEDGISDEEAVAIALWNNAPFHEALAGLGFARADLTQAGLLRNPVFSVLFPLGPKQLEFTAKLPLEAFILRPARLAAARLDCERAAALLVESGLDLVRRVKRACADLALAREEAAIAGEVAAVRDEIAALDATRVRDGDASDLEASASRAASLEARREAGRLARQAAAGEERLKALLGLGSVRHPIDLRRDTAEPLFADQDAGILVEAALAARPDLRAAELALEAAGERAGLSRWEILSLSGIADANEKGERGFEIGPGLELEVPILNQNQGGRARAQAEIRRAAFHYVTQRDQIALEVKEAEAFYRQALEGLETGRGEIVPLLEEARRRAEKAYDAGETSRLEVLKASERLLVARSEQAKLAADLGRARADLERAVGRRLDRGTALPLAPESFAPRGHREEEQE